jgi:hypothetical protein
MYSCGPNRKEPVLDIYSLVDWLETVNPDRINSLGMYGGEPTINLDLYNNLIYEAINITSLKGKPLWMITNGTWSRDMKQTNDIIDFVVDHDVRLFISNTKEHQEHQDHYTIMKILTLFPEYFVLKEEKEVIVPMGRAQGKVPDVCGRICSTWSAVTGITQQ